MTSIAPSAAASVPHRAAVETRQEIELAEGVTIHLLVAGPVPRALAYGMDFLLRIGIYYMMAIFLGMASLAMEGVATGIMILGIFLLEWFYNVVFEQSRWGATPGQRMLGLRVVSETGAAPTPMQSVLRNLLRTADFLPVGYALGAVVTLCTKRFQRLGDLAAGTLVVHQGKADGEAQRRPLAPRSVPQPPPPAEAPLVPLTPEESRAVLQFEARLTTWTTPRQQEIASHAAGAIGRTNDPARQVRAVARWLQDPGAASAAAAAPEARWQQLDEWLTRLEHPRKKKDLPPPPWAALPSLFRQACADLALARQRCLSPVLIERINDLCLRTCQHLYGGRTELRSNLGRFFFVEFPQAVRTEWRLVAWCHFFFWFPFFCLLFWGDRDPRWFEAVLGPAGMQSLHEMYDDAATISSGRDSVGENFAMFGFYIWNNVGIAFRTFAGGILAGVGALFITAYNGVAIGAAAGYITRAADPVAFWTFVSGHAAFELTGIVLSAAAGVRLGLALVAPGSQSRSRALANAARRAFPILSGASLLIVGAAFIEGFWSPLAMPPLLKYTVGLLLWVMLGAYFVFSGRRPRSA